VIDILKIERRRRRRRYFLVQIVAFVLVDKQVGD